MAVALKMNGIHAAEAALFFLERLATAVIILLHGKTLLLLVINLLLFAATSILYTVPYLARLHLGRPYSDKSDDKRYFHSEQLGLFFVVPWILGGCSYGLTLGRAVLIYKNLVYFFDYLGIFIAEDEDDDDETKGKVEDHQIEQKEEAEYQVAEDNVSSNDKETEKKENSAEFPRVVITSFEDWLCVDVNDTQDNKNNGDKDEKEKVDGDVDEEDDDYDEEENGSDDDEDEKENEDGDSEEKEEERKDEKEEEGEGDGVDGVDAENATEENKVEEELQELRVEFVNLKKEKDLTDQAFMKRAQELYDNLKHRTRTYSNKLKTDMETATASSEYTKKVALQLIKHLLKRYFNIQAQLAEIKAQVQDFEESRRDWNECKERLAAEWDAAVQSLDNYIDVIGDFEEAYYEAIKEKNSLIADAVNAHLGKSSQ